MLNMQARALNERAKIREEIFVKEQKELKKKISRFIEDQTRLGVEKIRMEESYAEHNARYLKLHEKLRMSQREHDKPKEEIIRLIEDHRQERKRIEEHLAKNYEECLKKTKEKDVIILHLNKKINGLDNQKLESALNERVKIREAIYVKEHEELKKKISSSIEDQRKLGEEKTRMEECYAELNAQYLKLEEKLRRSQREQNKSKEEIIRLIEDQRGEKKRIEELYAKEHKEFLKKIEEKDEMILELNKKIKELESQKLESEHTAEIYKLKVKSSDLMVAQKNGEIEALKFKKSEADHIVEELRCKEEKYVKAFEELNEKLHRSQNELDKSKDDIIRLIEDQRGEKERIEECYAKDCKEYLKNTEEKDEMILELNKKIEELENQKLESEHTAEMCMLNLKSSDLMVAQMNGVVEELKREKAEADKKLEEYRQRFETLIARVRMLEQDLANVLNLSRNKLANQANKMEKKSATAQEGALCVSSCGCENESSIDGRRRENDDLQNQVLEHFQDESNLKNGTAADGLSSMVVSARQTSGNEMNRGQHAIDTIIDHNGPIKEHLEPAGCSREISKSLECVDIIEIDDSDDEAIEQEGSLVSSTSKRKKSTNGNENDETFLICVQKEKRRRELISDGPNSFMEEYFLKSISVAVDQPFHGIASSDSDDDSISSSHIDDLIASC